jgi:dihydrofolate reductase
MVWGQASNGVIGRDGTMPWHLPEDFKHVRSATAGQPVIMGRLTWDSLPERSRPLPGRTNIVITGQPDWAADGAVRAGSLGHALELGAAAAGPGDTLWIIGGRRVYDEATNTAGTALITVIDAVVVGDTYAPALGPDWVLDTVDPVEDWHTGADGTRCDTRNGVLRRDLTAITVKPGTKDCVIASGTLADKYTGKTINFTRGENSADVQIDHIIPLSLARQTGAQQIGEEQRKQLANDPLNLMAADGPTNGSKGDKDAATWLPPNKAFRCEYVTRQTVVKAKYKLWMTQAEHTAVAGILKTCK